MAAKQFELALAFLQSQPAAAARLLERQPPAEVASFLSGVPCASATGIFRQMLPYYTAGVCQHLLPETSAAILAPLNHVAIAAILRDLPREMQDLINHAFPERLKLSLRILFDYAEDSIGAWMIPNGLSLPIDYRVSEALERISQSEDESNYERIPIVDRAGSLQGEVTLRGLLATSNETALSSIMQAAELRLLGRSNIKTASNHPGWRSRDILPVVNREAKLVGVLRHTDLRRGLAHEERPPEEPPAQGILSQMIQAYTACFIAMANTLFESEKP